MKSRLLAGRLAEILLHRIEVVGYPAGFMAGLIVRNVGVRERDICATIDCSKNDFDFGIFVCFLVPCPSPRLDDSFAGIQFEILPADVTVPRIEGVANARRCVGRTAVHFRVAVAVEPRLVDRSERSRTNGGDREFNCHAAGTP